MEYVLSKPYTNKEKYDFIVKYNHNMGLEISETENGLIAKEHEPTQEELLQKEMVELQLWFEEYDNQVKQYIRCQRLGIEYDKDINELDNQAQINAQRVSEIRALLRSNLND